MRERVWTACGWRDEPRWCQVRKAQTNCELSSGGPPREASERRLVRKQSDISAEAASARARGQVGGAAWGGSVADEMRQGGVLRVAEAEAP